MIMTSSQDNWATPEIGHERFARLETQVAALTLRVELAEQRSPTVAQWEEHTKSCLLKHEASESAGETEDDTVVGLPANLIHRLDSICKSGKYGVYWMTDNAWLPPEMFWDSGKVTGHGGVWRAADVAFSILVVGRRPAVDGDIIIEKRLWERFVTRAEALIKVMDTVVPSSTTSRDQKNIVEAFGRVVRQLVDA